jgi:hypothetical protein
MVIGYKKEEAVLKAFKRNLLVNEFYECGLIENKTFPRVAASPDTIAVVQIRDEETVVFLSTAEAETIAHKYSLKTIKCNVGDEVWKEECADADHSTQILVQLCTLQVAVVVYVVAQPGTKNEYGRIIYTVVAECPNEVVGEFTKSYFPAIRQ